MIPQEIDARIQYTNNDESLSTHTAKCYHSFALDKTQFQVCN